MESPQMLNSVEDECRYWKERAKFFHKEWTDVKQEFDEYVEQSRQVEAEMDATLDQKQKAIKDLRIKATNLEKENESLRLKLDSHVIEFTNIEKQLESVKIERDSMKEYLRQLEQKNDDLERAHRILNESIADFEAMLDKAYEKNALLEMEVDEKEMLQEKLQRLMDETRDLKQELNVKARYPSNTTTNTSITATIPNGVVENNTSILNVSDPLNLSNNQLQQNSAAATTITINDYNQHSLKNPENLLNGNAMAASSRTTALNIVADMLRKLNLDKALICSHCDKFRCVCERPLSATSSSIDNIVSCKPNGAISRCTSCDSNYPTSDSLLSSTSNLNNQFGTNIFKRFAQRFNSSVSSLPHTAADPTDDGNVDSNTQNAMETKLKTYREQAPAMPPRQ